MDVAIHDTDEPTVVVAGGDADWIRSSLEHADVVTAGSVEALLDVVDDRTVECVVTTAALPDATPTDLVAAVRDRATELPVVFAPREPDPEAASAVTAAAATHYLPGSVIDGADLQSTVHDAVDAYDRRRQARREQEMFRALLEQSPLSIYFKDHEARHVAVSDKADEAVDDRMIGKTDVDLLEDADVESPESVHEAHEDDLTVVETGEAIADREERFELQGGEELCFRTSKLPWREDGEVVGVLGITRDVTAEKRREEELEREKRRLEQFASFASHDLRNPIMVASGFLAEARQCVDELEPAAESSSDGDESEPAVEELSPTVDDLDAHLDQVDEELDRMERLIDDLLEIAAPDDERAEEWTPLASVVERAWAAVDAPAATLTNAVPDDVEVRAASGALRQLLENVLTNSVEHGGRDVAVEVGLTETGFYVADDGPGIPAADRGRVVEYGYTTGGTGVGLAIAAEIADAHGWELSVGESAADGARLAFDRTLRRATDTPELTEEAAISLDSQTTIGSGSAVGGATRGDDGAWTVRGGGQALWGGIEGYAAVHGTADGDVRVVGRLTGVEEVHEYSKAGLLVADAVEPGAPLGFVGMTAAHGTEVAWRTEPDGSVDTTQAEPDVCSPRWYRIDRVDDRVTCYASAHGESWTMLDQHVLPLGESAAVGLAVSSHDADTACEATFEDVRVVPLETSDGS